MIYGNRCRLINSRSSISRNSAHIFCLAARIYNNASRKRWIFAKSSKSIAMIWIARNSRYKLRGREEYLAKHLSIFKFLPKQRYLYKVWVSYVLSKAKMKNNMVLKICFWKVLNFAFEIKTATVFFAVTLYVHIVWGLYYLTSLLSILEALRVEWRELDAAHCFVTITKNRTRNLHVYRQTLQAGSVAVPRWPLELFGPVLIKVPGPV